MQLAASLVPDALEHGELSLNLVQLGVLFGQLGLKKVALGVAQRIVSGDALIERRRWPLLERLVAVIVRATLVVVERHGVVGLVGVYLGGGGGQGRLLLLLLLLPLAVSSRLTNRRQRSERRRHRRILLGYGRRIVSKELSAIYPIHTHLCLYISTRCYIRSLLMFLQGIRFCFLLLLLNVVVVVFASVFSLPT